MSDATVDPSGREYGRVVFVLGCVLALVLAAALLPTITTTFAESPIESLFPSQQSGDRGDGNLGALNPGSTTGVGGINGNGSTSLRSLGPEVHFTVESTEPAYWRTAAYSTYTGSDWKRSGTGTAYDGPIETTGLANDSVSYRVTVNRSAAAVPTVWQPRSVSLDAPLEVTDGRAIRTTGQLSPGTTYQATSSRPPRDPAVLSAAGRDYPQEVADRYTQLPESTPSRLGSFTDQLTANASTPYETAKRVETWLEANKSYSLNVSRPSGNRVASDFVFEMERGYCEYYATSMVAMLRTQGIPARYVLGYSTGQPTGENTYTVRGMNAHAWVEVYFEDVGWVRFDPTPGQERLQAEQQALQSQRPDAGPYDHTERGSPGEQFDPAEDDPPTPDPTTPDDPPTPDPTTPTPTEPDDENGTDDGPIGDGPGQFDPNSQEGYDVSLSRTPVPGSTVDVTVRENGASQSGVVVLFNSERVGLTGADGTVTGTVPFTDRLNVTIVDHESSVIVWNNGTVSGGSNTDETTATSGGTLTDGRQYAITAAFASPISHATESVPSAVADEEPPRGGETDRSMENATVRSYTYDVATDASLSLSGTIATGQEVVATVTVGGSPVPNATVSIDGERVGQTDDDGRVELWLPTDPGNVTLSAQREPISGNRTVALERLRIEAEPTLPVALPWSGVEVTARLGNETVADVPVYLDGDRVGTTGVDGTFTATLPLSDSGRLSVAQYGQRPTTTVGGLWLNTGGVLAGLLVVVGGLVLVRRRQTASLTTLLDRAIVGLFSLPHRVVGALIAAADRLVRVGAWAAASARRGFAALGAFLRGQLTLRALLGAFRNWVAETAGLAHSELGREPAGTPDVETEPADSHPAAYVTIREAWGRFLNRVSVREPETKTPAELAAHAVEHDGLPADAVATLRDAFRAVEYGALSPEEHSPTVQSAIERISERGED